MLDQALLSLRPGAEWTLNGDTYEGLVWLDTVQQKPTLEEINEEIERLTIEFNSKQYQRDRAVNYPNVKEQLDMIWHAINQDKLDKTSDFYLALKSVKDTHPKIIIPTQPYPSWVLNTNTWLWEPPTPMPDDGNNYHWDEDTQNWTL
jgi:hypothetical protein